MTDTKTLDGKTYIKTEDSAGVITLTPVQENKPGNWAPKRSEDYFYINENSAIIRGDWHDTTSDRRRLEFGNVYPTPERAEKACDLMRRSNLIIQTFLDVDPDFEPDWDDVFQPKWHPIFSEGSWEVDYLYDKVAAPAHVSTREKCEEVCRRLTEMGVK